MAVTTLKETGLHQFLVVQPHICHHSSSTLPFCNHSIHHNLYLAAFVYVTASRFNIAGTLAHTDLCLNDALLATPEDTLRQCLREASNAKSQEPSSNIEPPSDSNSSQECSPAEATASEKTTCFEGALFPDMMTRTPQALIDGPTDRSESEVDAQTCPTCLCEPAN